MLDGVVQRTPDFGATWERRNEKLDFPAESEHLVRKVWQPGGGGLMVHTILVDPQDPNRIYVAISAAGTYRSDDGGKSWTAKNKSVRADFMPEKYPVFGQCVHKLAMHPAKPDMLYQQNHCGVYRSENRGDDRSEITEGLPDTAHLTVLREAMAVDSADQCGVYVGNIAGGLSR